MNMFFTQGGFRRWWAVIPLLSALQAGAQGNIAPAATVTHHTSRAAGGGIGLHSPHLYNDGFIGAYPGTFTAYVNPGGFIEFEWPNAQTFNRVVAYKGARAFDDATLEYWDGSAYQTITSFRSSQAEADSVSFAAVTTTKLRINRISSQGREPLDFREIVVRQAPDRACSGTPSAGLAAPLTQTRCLGEEALLVAGGYTLGASFQWQVNPGSGWTDINGATNSWYRFRVTSATPANADYRLRSVCGSGSPVYSSTGTVTVSGGYNAGYASLPYFQGFETTPWLNGCGTADYPAANWTADNVAASYKWAASNSRNSKWPFPAVVSGTYAARFYAQYNGDTPPFSADLDLHVNCSAQPGPHRVEFLMANVPDAKGPTPGNDYLMVYVSTDGGQNFTPVAGWEDEPVWSKKTVLFNSSGANTIIRFRGYSQSDPGQREASDIGLDSVHVKAVDPCSGTPGTPTITPAGPVTLCAGQATTLSASGVDQVPGITVKWQQAPAASGPWTDAVGGTGAGTPVFNTPVLYDTIWYRLQVGCTGSVPGTSVSSAVGVRVSSPVYASIPFTESFEEWATRCATGDVPSLSWVNTPSSGTNSWRREDMWASAWGLTENYAMYPDAAFDGSHSARFHTQNNFGKKGVLDLFINCSTQPGDKELRFALNMTKDRPANVNNPNPAPNGYDYIKIYMSVDEGKTFTQLDHIAGPAFSKWEIKSVTVPSVSATTIIRFEATSVTGYRDMGLDYVRVLPACSGQPEAGSISNESPCADKDFFLRLNGTSQSAGLTYQWQRSVNGNIWINMPGTASDIYTTQISARTWFRVIVTCPASGLRDTTPVRVVDPAPFYYCYCESGFNAERTLNFNYTILNCGKNIGNVTITKNSGDTVLNNGNYVPWFSHPETDLNPYSNFTKTVAPTPLYLDSSYKFTIHSIHTSTVGANPVKWTAYIDFNQDGIYDTATERIWIDLRKNTDTRPSQGSGVPWGTYAFSVPGTAKTGLTGMRVIMLGGGCTEIPAWNAGPVPCGFYGDGETEDYVVDIRFAECDGPVATGTTVISHERHCPGYTVTASNTNHEYQRSGIGWDWQSSADGNTWTAVAGSSGKDTISHILTGNTWFRLRMVCVNTRDTSYSNVVSVSMKEPYQCYCYSEANGAALDTSDVGLITINGRSFGAAGGHLNNAAAVNGRTDHTDSLILISKDQPLELALTHILRSSRHADAKVTVFIDYNNNLRYDLPDELVWTTNSSSTSWNLSQSVTIPATAVADVPTGLRVVLNNNTAANVPSDEGCGAYTSGETEDYVVRFQGGVVNSVGTLSAGSVHIYPNPTTGKVFVKYHGREREQTVLMLQSVTGQVIRTITYGQITDGQQMELDLTGLANGMYHIRLSTSSGSVNHKLTLTGQ